MLLTIEKQVYGGDGLARLRASSPNDESEKGRGKAVFLPLVLAGEQVEASFRQQKADFALAKVDQIVQPSPHRVEPPCPYFARCGGCHYQHASYEHQLEIKKQILLETLRRTAKLELHDEIQVHPSPPWNYRNRSRLQVQTVPEFAIGYFQRASHQVLPVENCPISSPLINRGIACLWQSGRQGEVPAGLREIEFFSNADDSQLLIEIYCAADSRRASLRAWAEQLSASMPEIAGIVAFRAAQPTGSRSASRKTEKLVSVGVDHLLYRTQRHSYRVSAGSFFQTNRFLIDKLVEIVTQGESGDLALDLYAGVGLFSTALCDVRHIVSVESSQTSTGDLAYNLPANGKAVRATTEEFLASAETSGRVGKGLASHLTTSHPDLAVVDPPRNGLGDRVARRLANLGAPRITYVSCDPATLARDLVPLLASGYRVERVHLVDLFPQTYHVETVVQLAR